MLHWLIPHLSLMYLVRVAGYPGLFAIVFLESGVFFGFFLPGASMLFTAGLLASKGLFNVWLLIVLLAIAAILGDSAGYWFGSYVGHALFTRKSSGFFRQEHLAQAHDFYERHGVYAIVLARFVPVVRTFAPIIAGIVEMRYRTFLFYNIIGGIVWACGTTFLGFYLGEKVPFVQQYLTPIIILIVIATTIPLLWHAYRDSSKKVSRSA